MFCFFSTSQLRALKQATNINGWRFAALQWGRQAASLQVLRSGFWGVERLSKDNTIKFRWWFLHFCWYLKPFSLSPQQCYMKGMQLASGCWPHSQEQQDAGCTQDCTSCLVLPPSGQGWSLWPHSPACAHIISFYAELCDSLSVVPSRLLPKSLSQCNFPAPAFWLQPSLLQSCCSPPNSSTWGLPHTLACILAH